MIKWGRRKKQQPPSSPRPSLLSSWLGRLKKMGGATANAAGHHNDVVFASKHNNPAPPPPVIKAACCRSRSTNHHNEELYGGDEDFWRLSFRKEKMYSGYETEEEEDEKREAFTEMVSGIRRMKELQKITTTEKLKEREFKSATPRRKVVIKSGDERRSVYVNRGSPKRRGKKQGISCRARVVSPRVSSSKKERLERFAVVKCSLDPERDFKESMVEMILERNICGAQQLEDLLACYLALNSDQYHHLIIKVFRQIWFDLNI